MLQQIKVGCTLYGLFLMVTSNYFTLVALVRKRIRLSGFTLIFFNQSGISREFIKKENRQVLYFKYLAIVLVGVLGLEPRMTGPESVVLPLHHTPKSQQIVPRRLNADAKVHFFFKLTMF